MIIVVLFDCKSGHKKYAFELTREDGKGSKKALGQITFRDITGNGPPSGLYKAHSTTISTYLVEGPVLVGALARLDGGSVGMPGLLKVDPAGTLVSVLVAAVNLGALGDVFLIRELEEDELAKLPM